MIEFDCQKKLGSNFALDARLRIEQGEFVCLYGRSGSGKTTILRILAGFIRPDSGRLSVHESVFFDSARGVFLPPQKRGIGFLFQDYALFDNMNVIKNLLFANKDIALARQLLGFVELGDHEKARIHELSGGQKQRVALARALMRRPQILLLDEPLSALDHTMREKLQDYIIKIHKEFGMTTVLVSHDISEIYKMSDRVFKVENGVVTADGTPDGIFLRTSGSRKFSFPGQVVEVRPSDGASVVIASVGNQLTQIVLTPAKAAAYAPGDEVTISAKAFGLSLERRDG